VIPADSITAWGVDRRWPNRAAVEQDLLLGRHRELSDRTVSDDEPLELLTALSMVH
jgi:hypothetical protein